MVDERESTVEQSQGVVLVVDDSPDSLSMLNDALEQQGYTVLIALEGRQALAIAGKIRPDIILLDAIMPAMDGFDTCRQLKLDPSLAEIPVIFMTGLADTESIVRGLEAGGVDYLTKPVSIDELVARMRVHLANAKLKHSAQLALDSTGQHLFSINGDGALLWATPQTHDLFRRAGLDDAWLRDEFSAQLRRWLGFDPQDGHGLPLETPEYPLQVKMVRRSGSGEIMLKLIDGRAPSGAERLRLHLPVTERESEVLFWIGNGKTNREIGQILDTSPRTVNKHLEQIFRKLEVDNRTSAAAIALRYLLDEG
ncbi:response regulator transcription factor [Mangrovimicrobium sediminis]|uniref:Response regulator transcription factor n=1 Tax=Mangrovimicrobium sediminis TaxID=2562682 RepID=A0A4Z0M6I5_9GAMM|nr:response regulator transcription factor [Haliea sp. SAOS-164]TGD74925.1 response regulator transcription factor [Haliea sp. SAOS-164]